jgi:uncharacterized protein (TIGR02284 family)
MQMTTADIKQENKELSSLININEDACEFYEYAQEKAEDPEIKKTFRDLEGIHKNVVITLQQRVRTNGGTSDAGETIMGQAQKLWGELMASISNDVDETLVVQLEEAEDRCLHSMEDAIASDHVTSATRAALQEELNSLRKSHDYMKTLKENMKNAA